MKVIWIFQAIKWFRHSQYAGNVKRGGVCIYFKDSLSIRFLDVPSNLDECLLCELSYKNKKYFIATLNANDTSLLSIVNDANKSFENLSNDLCIISNWDYQWKMSFNLDRSKQAQEVIV